MSGRCFGKSQYIQWILKFVFKNKVVVYKRNVGSKQEGKLNQTGGIREGFLEDEKLDSQELAQPEGTERALGAELFV